MKHQLDSFYPERVQILVHLRYKIMGALFVFIVACFFYSWPSSHEVNGVLLASVSQLSITACKFVFVKSFCMYMRVCVRLQHVDI